MLKSLRLRRILSFSLSPSVPKLFRLLSLLLLYAACTPDKSAAPEAQTEVKAAVIPVFQADTAYSFTKTQTDMGPRAMNTKAHERCANFIIAQGQRWADTVFVQQARLQCWNKEWFDISNIIYSFSPEKQTRILLCTHWDSRNWADQDTVRRDQPVEAANDGAAGVGVLMEVARQLKLQKPDVGVDILFIDAEDQGQPDDSGLPPNEDSWCLGTQYWSKTPHIPGYTANYGILLDMIGAQNAIFTQEGGSVQNASSVLEKVWRTAGQQGFSDYFSYDRTAPIIDDHYYINSIAHIPTIDIIQYDASSPSRFYRNWHTHQDKLEYIDKNSLRAVGQTLLGVIYNEK